MSDSCFFLTYLIGRQRQIAALIPNSRRSQALCGSHTCKCSCSRLVLSGESSLQQGRQQASQRQGFGAVCSVLLCFM